VLALLTGLALLIGCAGEDLETRLADLRARQDEGNAAATLDEYAELAESHPDNAEINFRLGLAMIAAGRHTEALFPLYKAADSDSLSVPAGIVLASTLSQTNNHAEAVRATGQVLDIEPGNEAALLMRTAAAIELHDGEIALEASENTPVPARLWCDSCGTSARTRTRRGPRSRPAPRHGRSSPRC
jgi:tetratricopeptide (TPR) repeat protein